MKKTKLLGLLLALAVCLPVYGAFSPFGAAYAAESADDTASPSPSADLADIYAKLNALGNQIYDLQQIINGNGQNNAPQPEPTPTPVYAPKLKLISPFSATVTGRLAQNVEITVKNLGTSYAGSVLVQASAGGDAPFALSFPDGSNSFPNLGEGNSKTMTMRIAPDADAKSGAYPVTLTYSYKNAASENLTGTDTLTIKVDNAQYTTNVILYNFKSDKEPMTPGDSATIQATLENTGSAAATDVQVTIDGFDAGVYMRGDAVTYFRSVPTNSQRALKIPVTVSAGAKPGTYPLMFKVGYKDTAGAAASNSFVYYLNVDAAGTVSGRGKVEITGVSSPGGKYTAGQDFTFNVDIKNTGTADAENVKVTAAPADGAIVPKSVNTLLIGSLAPDEARSLAFTFAATADAKDQNYIVNFQLSYESGALAADGSPETVTLQQYAGANVSVPPPASPSPSPSPSPGAGVSKPKIIIDSYATDPQIVKAGQNFALKLVFMNTHKTKTINNIKIVLAALETTSQTGSVFSPVDCSNTIYIDEIPPGGKYEKDLTMYTVPDAVPRTYTIAVNYRYQDGEYNDYDESEQIGISVKQATKLETSEFTIPSDGMPGQPIPLSFSIINSGKVDLANLRVSVEADMDTTNANVYLGSLKLGSSTYFDGYIVPTDPGLQQGKLVISCEDSTGEIVSIEKDFEVNVADMGGGMGGDGMGGMPMPADPGAMGAAGGAAGGFLGMFRSLSRTVAIVIEAGIAAAVIVLAAVIIAAARRRRRRRRQEEDDE